MTTTARARLFHGVTAVCAWAAVLLNVFVSAMGWFPESAHDGYRYGVNGRDPAHLWPRLFDTVSYFTIWANAVVAVSSTQLVLGPWRSTPLRRALRLTALLMITVTAIVYAVLLAPTATVEGWSRLTNPLAHIVVPALAVSSFLLVGPRGWIDGRALAASLVIPLTWIVYMLVRGEIIRAYPYDFADVLTHGYPYVMAWVGGILVFALVIAALYGLTDRTLRHLAARRDSRTGA